MRKAFCQTFRVLLWLGASAVLHGETKPRPLMLEGDEAFKAGKYDLAIDKYTAQLKLTPNDPVACNNRALAYREKTDYAHAIDDFSKALKLKPEWYVYLNRGTAYQGKGDNKSAIADYNRALKLAPGDKLSRSVCLTTRAQAYFDQQEAEPALADLNAAIKLGVDYPHPFVLRGILHKINHQYDRSLADYDRAIALEPKDPEPYETEAYLLSVCPMPKYRDAKKAIAYATKACELTKWKQAAAIETLAAAYAESGDFDEAIKWQEKAGKIDSKAFDATRLDLYRKKEPFRDLNRKEPVVAHVGDIKNKVVVRIGEKLSAQFEIRDDELIQPQMLTAPEGAGNCLMLQFRQEKGGRTLFLSHSFRRVLQARCLARLKDYDAYFETDILPIPVNTLNPEIWSEPIEELVLFDFKLTRAFQPSPKKGEADLAKDERSRIPKS